MDFGTTGFLEKKPEASACCNAKTLHQLYCKHLKITNGSSWQSSASLLYLRRGCEFFTIYESAINKSSQWLLWPEKQPQLSLGCCTTVLGF